MTTESNATYYDRYWQERDRVRSRDRSRRRAELALKLLGPQRGTLLEVGCGPGWALETFQKAGFAASGIDVSDFAVEEARRRGLDVHVCDLLSEELSGEYDVIASLEVLEHLPDPLRLMRAMAKALKPGGQLLVSLPNEWTLPRRLLALLGRPGFGGHDDPHMRHFCIRSSMRLFDVASVRPIRTAWDGLIPPRWVFLKRLTEPLASVFPGLFAICGVHLIEPKAGAVAGHRQRTAGDGE